jgi:L-alanine-DL-glutamate epimerase-like enolase superfamily enzyme
VIKIKSGSPGSQSVMLANDMERLTSIHQAIQHLRTDQTANGKLVYTIDVNARYEKKETLLKYLDHARKIGAFGQILVIEEPLAEQNEEYVGDAGIRIAADESVHNEKDAVKKLEQGYQGLVLKGIAKSLSLSMKVAAVAEQKGVPCLVADLTVNPILIDWNKNLAARLKPFPGLGMGLLETNGDKNYKNWNKMVGYNPTGNAPWTKVRKGVFELGKDYYQQSGGIMQESEHYRNMFK